MKREHKALIVVTIISVLSLFLCLLPSQRDYDTLDYFLEDDPIFEIDPLFKDMNLRLLIFDKNRHFDLNITPVENMVILLQSLDSFYLCDEEWMKDMQYCSAYLKEQYRLHKNSLDPQMQELMSLQRNMIEKLDILIRETDSDCIDELKEAFEEYRSYYETSIREGGTLNGEEKAG